MSCRIAFCRSLKVELSRTHFLAAAETFRHKMSPTDEYWGKPKVNNFGILIEMVWRKPEPNNKVTKLRQPPPARKLRKQLSKQLAAAAAAQKARENSNVIKSTSAYKEAGLTKICGSATGGATKTNINLKDKLYYFKVHFFFQSITPTIGFSTFF